VEIQPALSFCEVQGRFVFLDAKADRYFSLGGALEVAWRATLAGGASAADRELLAARGLADPAVPAAVLHCPDDVAESSLLEGEGPARRSLGRSLVLPYDEICSTGLAGVAG
jgi:hypothetical protein